MSHEDVILVADERTITGKKVSRLREDGKVPVVLYDQGKAIHLTVEAKVLDKAFSAVGRSQPLELNLNGKKQLVMFKVVDRHPVKHTLRHVAFKAIKRNEKQVADVPVRIRLDEGNEVTPAERASLIVLRALDSIEIRALPKDLPEEIFIYGEKLVEAGDHLTVADLELPSGVELTDTEPEVVLASVYEPSALAAANDDAGGDVDQDTEDAADEVGAEHGQDTGQSSHDAENRPGGKKEFERKGE